MTMAKVKKCSTCEYVEKIMADSRLEMVGKSFSGELVPNITRLILFEFASL